MFDKFKAFISRWQEKIILLPLLLIMGLAAWIVLGALDRTAGTDVLAQWVELPIRCAYAVAALALAGLARRRWRYKLTDAQQADWWLRLTLGQRGARTIFITDAVLTLACIALLLHFFAR